MNIKLNSTQKSQTLSPFENRPNLHFYVNFVGKFFYRSNFMQITSLTCIYFLVRIFFLSNCSCAFSFCRCVHLYRVSFKLQVFNFSFLKINQCAILSPLLSDVFDVFLWFMFIEVFFVASSIG